MPTTHQLLEKIADLQLGYSTEKREHLEVRRRGADNKDKGTEFERHYGVLHLMRGAFNSVGSGSNGTDFRVSNNLVADVDDVFVAEPNSLTFSQAKDRKELGWKEITERFNEQLRELNLHGLLNYSNVEVVVSRPELQEKLINERPKKFSCVYVVYFNTECEEFIAYAERLTTRNYDPVARFNARHHYYDSWRTLDFSATVYQVAFRANYLSYGNMRTLEPSVELSDDIADALSNVEFLRAEVIGRRLYYAYNDEELAPQRWEIGTASWSNFVRSLLNAEHLDYLGFLNLMGEIR